MEILNLIFKLAAGIGLFLFAIVNSAAQNDTSGEIGVSSLIDTWIVVRELEEDLSKKRIRGLFIVKSRGTGHDSDVHKLILSDDGIKLMPMDSEPTQIDIPTKVRQCSAIKYPIYSGAKYASQTGLQHH